MQCTNDEEYRVAVGSVYEAMSSDQANAVSSIEIKLASERTSEG